MGILRKMKQRAAEMEKSYFPYTWKDKPSIESPINSVNLNHIESGINELDNRVVVLSKDKAEKTELANVFINFEFDENSGVMTFTRFDGSKVEKDTAMEKIALNCYLEGDNFVLELADGSKQTVSLSKFIDTYTFKSTDVIRMSVNGKEVSADIPDGKITLEKLEATVMSTIRQCVLDAQTAKGVAEQAASTAQGWAIGGESFEKNNAKYFSGQSKRYAVGGVEEGDETDNAQYYCEEARKAAEQAAGSVGFDGTASSVSAVDTHNLTGAGAGKKSTVQNLLDVIAQKLVEKVVTSDTFQIVLAKYLVNNGLTTEAGKFGLDAAFGKNLQDQITQQNSNLSNKNIIGTYNIPDITGVSTAPENIAGGYHNVAKYSNGQCMYSALVYVYTSAISNSVIGTISSQYAPKQDISAYVYDFAGKRFLMILISPNGTIKLLTLEGTSIPESAVKVRGSIVF